MEKVHRPFIIYRTKEESLKCPSLGWWLLFASLLHLLGWKLPTQLPLEIKKQTKEPILVSDLGGKERKPVVKTSRSYEEADEKKSVSFYSDFTNRVKKETQAPLIGPFHERQTQSSEISKQASRENISSTPEEESHLGSSFPTHPPSQGMPNPPSKAVPVSKIGMHDLMNFSRTPHALSKDIPEGSQTFLNTDKIVYASFINRIAEEIYEPWVAYAQAALRESLSHKKKVEPTTYITKLNVVMNEAGEVVAMTITQASALPALDDAPKKAFWKIARFPNPPPQLIDIDGFIRLNYEFHFEWKNSFFNITPYYTEPH